MQLLGSWSSRAGQQWPHVTTQPAAAGVMELARDGNFHPGARRGTCEKGLSILSELVIGWDGRRFISS